MYRKFVAQSGGTLKKLNVIMVQRGNYIKNIVTLVPEYQTLPCSPRWNY